jgi:murein L,D-transpeptidase YafK
MGAFPIDYPNEWDRRTGRTGYGIWLHGVPSDTFARAPLASDGCIVLSNPDMARLGTLVQIGATPVIVADRITWESAASVEGERKVFLRQLETWRVDWESRDSRRYLANYAREFRSGQTSLQAWSAQKIAVNRSKEWIKVTLGNVSVFRRPGKDKVMVVTFDQDYRSSNLSQKSRKRQYWVEDGGRWKIAYEGLVSGAAPTLPESYKRARRT